MQREIPEKDWKIFRELRPMALDRFCQRVLVEVGRLSAEAGKNYHERYLAVYKLIEQRDKELGEAFDAMRRSTALLQLAIIRSRGLLEDEEFARFSPETQEAVRMFSRE